MWFVITAQAIVAAVALWVLVRIERQQRIILLYLRHLLCPHPDAGFSILITGETMADRLQFRLLLPEKSAPDVVSRACAVSIGETTTAHDLAADAVSIDGLEGDEGAMVSATLIDTDNAGNASPERTFGPVALADTFAPPQPGEMGIEVSGETH